MLQDSVYIRRKENMCKSKFRVKNDIEGDIDVNLAIEFTKHAVDRQNQRQFKETHLFECLEKGVTKLGKQTAKYECKPFKNTATVLRDGKFTKASVVYVVLKGSNQRDEKVRVITMYYND